MLHWAPGCDERPALAHCIYNHLLGRLFHAFLRLPWACWLPPRIRHRSLGPFGQFFCQALTSISIHVRIFILALWRSGCGSKASQPDREGYFSSADSRNVAWGQAGSCRARPSPLFTPCSMTSGVAVFGTVAPSKDIKSLLGVSVSLPGYPSRRSTGYRRLRRWAAVQTESRLGSRWDHVVHLEHLAPKRSISHLYDPLLKLSAVVDIQDACGCR